MTRYFIAPDGEGEPTLWQVNADHPEHRPLALCRRADTGDAAWGILQDGLWLRRAEVTP